MPDLPWTEMQLDL